ncbi:Short-chain dehydrogenase/reductase family protein [Mycena chlorophos]|uniref:Short-chain dehydrogenase/reductase family protein n=1 Tax=Mycena chlorophos TaxID=658473 RepID=A0A8H6SDC9_MYCCL|nr:Short-chain dehydrogenase/reductase family protein [Mycena chlorophos]
MHTTALGRPQKEQLAHFSTLFASTSSHHRWREMVGRLRAFLFSQTARVYTLRGVVLASAIALAALLLLWLNQADFFVLIFLGPANLIRFLCGGVGCLLVIIHHFYIASPWAVPKIWIAVPDLLFLGVELGLIATPMKLSNSPLHLALSNLLGDNVDGIYPMLMYVGAGGAAILLLCFSIAFRVATLATRGPLGFLGGCSPVYPPYNLKTIFLNRTLTRPLVRGESRLILFVRAFFITCIAIAVPAFAIYAIIVLPSQSIVYAREISQPTDFEFPSVPIAFMLECFGSSAAQCAGFDVNINNGFESGSGTNYTNLNSPAIITVPSTFYEAGFFALTVDFTQTLSGSNVSANFAEGSFVTVSITPVQASSRVGSLLPPNWPSNTDAPPANLSTIPHVIVPAEPMMLLQGDQVIGLLKWTVEQTLHPSLEYVVTPQASALRPVPGAPALSPTSPLASLRLFDSNQIKYYQQRDDASVLSGISDLGGFWTFVDGAFALLFGANFIYFAFGHRPLSALGIIHLFQRRTLVRNWNEDFPALHTEGGQPGSDSAGIVAFVRERLVGVGVPPPRTTRTDGASESGSETDLELKEVENSSFDEPDDLRTPLAQRFERPSAADALPPLKPFDAVHSIHESDERPKPADEFAEASGADQLEFNVSFACRNAKN